MYLGAISELLAGTIVLCFIITWFHDCVTGTNKLWDNPIHNMVGYNNPCAFWDQPPALYFAFMMYCPMVYLAIRYAHIDSMRADMTYTAERRPSLSGDLKRARGNAIINWLYAFSQCLVMGIFVVPPLVADGREAYPKDPMNPTKDEIDNMHHHMHLHAFFFLQLVPSLCLAITANYYEAHSTSDVTGIYLSQHQFIVLGFYIVATIMETCCASYAIFGYTGRYLKDEPQFYQLHPWFMQTVDYSWFLSLPLVTYFGPPAPNIVCHYTLEKIGVDFSPLGSNLPTVIGVEEGADDQQ